MAFLSLFVMHKYTKMQDFRAFIHKILHNGCPCQARTDDTRINRLKNSLFLRIFKLKSGKIYTFFMLFYEFLHKYDKLSKHILCKL